MKTKTGENKGMMSTTFGRNPAASNLIIEDHIKKVLTLTSNHKKPFIEPKISKLIPRFNHSPFGDFPADYPVKKREQVRQEVIARQLGKNYFELQKEKMA